MPKQFINPEGLAAPPAGRYTQVVQAGSTVYIAGQTARDANGNFVGEGDIAEQYRQVWHNLQVAMDAVGGTVDDIVKLTTYVVGEENVEPLRQARARTTGKNPPANTLLVISRLADPRFLLEIEAVAELD